MCISFKVHGLFFFNDTATTEIYTLSLHDALPICCPPSMSYVAPVSAVLVIRCTASARSEEHTSELLSRGHLVCRLLLEKKKQIATTRTRRKKRSATTEP